MMKRITSACRARASRGQGPAGEWGAGAATRGRETRNRAGERGDRPCAAGRGPGSWHGAAQKRHPRLHPPAACPTARPAATPPPPPRWKSSAACSRRGVSSPAPERFAHTPRTHRAQAPRPRGPAAAQVLCAALAALLAARVPVPGRADAGQGTHRRSGCQHDAAAGSHWPADRAPAPMALGAARARPSALALPCMMRRRFLFLLRFFVCLYVSSLGLKTESVLRKTAHTFIVGTRLRGRDPPQLRVGTAEGQL